MIPAHVISRIKDATDLAALVADYVPLKRQAQRWVGRCCFHKERTASFGVHPEGFYKCFGCGAGGDCFNFLSAIEGINFTEAATRLAERAGVSLESRPVSRVAMAYAREEAELCRWWWAERRSAVLDLGAQELQREDADQGFLAALYGVREWIDAMTVGQRFEVFRGAVKAEDRERWTAQREYERAWESAWLSIA